MPITASDIVAARERTDASARAEAIAAAEAAAREANAELLGLRR